MQGSEELCEELTVPEACFCPVVVQIWDIPVLPMAADGKAPASPVVPSGGQHGPVWPLCRDSDEWEPSPRGPKVSFPSLPVRDPQGTIRLYTKGADTVILDRLRRRGPNETLTERALDVSPTPARGDRTALPPAGFGLGVLQRPAALPPSALGIWVLPSALGASPAYGTGGKRAWNPPSVFCTHQLHPRMLMGCCRMGEGSQSPERDAQDLECLWLCPRPAQGDALVLWE